MGEGYFSGSEKGQVPFLAAVRLTESPDVRHYPLLFLVPSKPV